MIGEKFKITKAFICCSNIIFMISGLVLMSLGILLLIDNNKILLSRLLNTDESVVKEPIFYYFALIVIGVGFLIALSGLLGCWVSCLANNCVTVLYIIILIILIISQLTVCVLAIFTPNLIGVDIRVVTLLRALQRNYGLPGRQQFTAALDLAQTTFSCCGINGSNNYGTSWWRLQEVGRRNLIVPLTCCLLNNTNNFEAFLNPIVKDLETCQTLNPVKHKRARYTTGCLEKIEEWTQEQALLLLIIGLSIMLIELWALLCTLMGYKRKSEPGTVGAMIEVFEDHLRTDLPSNNWSLQKNKFGVPLVGMHNACGLPVLAHWPQNKIPKKKVKRPAPKPPRTKRQAPPTISHEKNFQNRENFCRNRSNKRRTQLKSENEIEFLKPNSGGPGPKISYQKNSEPNFLRASHRAQFRRSGPKIRPNKKNCGDKNQVDFSRPRAGSLGTMPNKIESYATDSINQANYWNGKKFKRATVYAKDDGSSPIDVLTNLCLNPMARNSTSNMMW